MRVCLSSMFFITFLYTSKQWKWPHTLPIGQWQVGASSRISQQLPQNCSKKMIRKQLYSVTFEKVSRGYAKFTSWRIIPYNSCFLLFLLRLCAPWDSTTEMWPSEQRVQWFDKITKPHLFATSLCQQNEVENKRTAWSMLRLWSTKSWNH